MGQNLSEKIQDRRNVRDRNRDLDELRESMQRLMRHENHLHQHMKQAHPSMYGHSGKNGKQKKSAVAGKHATKDEQGREVMPVLEPIEDGFGTPSAYAYSSAMSDSY